MKERKRKKNPITYIPDGSAIFVSTDLIENRLPPIVILYAFSCECMCAHENVFVPSVAVKIEYKYDSILKEEKSS